MNLLQAWLVESYSGLSKKSVDQGDLAYCVTAALFAKSKSKTELSSGDIEILKTVVVAEEDHANNGCCDAVHNVGLCNNLKNEDIAKVLEGLSNAGVLKKAAYLAWKDWNL